MNNPGERWPNVQKAFEEAVNSTIMPLVVSLGIGDYWKRYHELLRADRLPSEALAERQWRAFKSLLTHAWDSVPLYRDAMENAGFTPGDVDTRADLVKLSTIDKRSIVSAFPDRMTSRTSNREQWRYRSTSGTAFRIMSVTDYSARQWRYALHLRSMRIAADWQVGMRQVVIRTQACTEACSASGQEEYGDAPRAMLPVEREWPPFGFAQLTLQETQLPPLAGRGTLVPDEVLDDCLRRIELAEPYLLRGLPTFLLLIARRLKAANTRAPSVQRIVVQDSLAPVEMKQEIAETFGCEVRETYGSSELGSMAAECERGWLHVASDLFMIEILRTDNTAAEPNETGVVTVTSMANYAMPVIRYRLGDLGRLVPGDCPCGRNTPRIVIDGRVHESLQSGARFVTPRDLSRAVHSFPGVEHFKLVEHTPERLTLEVEPSAGTALDSPRLRDVVKELLGPGRSVQVRTVEAIWPEESGKFAFVKSLPRDHHPREA